MNRVVFLVAIKLLFSEGDNQADYSAPTSFGSSYSSPSASNNYISAPSAAGYYSTVEDPFYYSESFAPSFSSSSSSLSSSSPSNLSSNLPLLVLPFLMLLGLFLLFPAYVTISSMKRMAFSNRNDTFNVDIINLISDFIL